MWFLAEPFTLGWPAWGGEGRQRLLQGVVVRTVKLTAAMPGVSFSGSLLGAGSELIRVMADAGSGKPCDQQPCIICLKPAELQQYNMKFLIIHPLGTHPPHTFIARKLKCASPLGTAKYMEEDDGFVIVLNACSHGSLLF